MRPTRCGRKGIGRLRPASKTPFGGERALEDLDSGEQVADADGADLAGLELQGAALGPEGRLGLEHDPSALRERDRHRVDGVHRHRHRQGHVDVGVAQGEEGGAAAWVELHDLALDPQLAHPVDVVGDLEAEHPHRPGLLGRRVGGLVGQRARHAHAGNDRGGRRLRPCGARARAPRTMGAMSRASRPDVRQEGPPRSAARLLRRCRPGRRDRREGPRALRAAGLRAQADRAQQARRHHAREARRDLRRRDRRGARGRHRHLLRPRRRPGRPRGGEGPQPQDDRRDLPARDEGAPRGRPLRRRRLRHPAHRPRGPRGGRRHRRRGARSTSRSSTVPTTSTTSPSATRRRSSGSRRPRCRSTRRWRRSRRLKEKFPALQSPPSDDICYATQNRQLAVKQMAKDTDLMIVVGSRNSSNSVRLVEVALEHGARDGPSRRLRRRDRRGVARGRDDRRRHLGRQRARGARP